MASEYLKRQCPSCKTESATPEVSSSPKGELAPFDKVADYWAGLFREKLFFSYHRCDSCGLLYAPTYFTSDQLSQLYSSMAPNMDLIAKDALEATQKGYWEAAKKAGGLVGNYLEIGPDIGYIVQEAAREPGFEHLYLFEPNLAVHEQLSAAAGDKLHTISPAMDDLSAVPDGSVGMAVMIHVLDHVLDPLTMLKNVRAKLREDGVLLIVTHNEASLLRKVMGTRWPPFCLQHPEIYNPKSITGLLNRSGYEEVRVERSENIFPLPFMVQQAAYAAGIRLAKVPLPEIPIKLRLGNMLTLARP